MPTTSQWKILHSLLRAGRLKQTDSTLDDGSDVSTDQDKENRDSQAVVSKKPIPQRRNSFHFSKNDRGELTVICRPKSVSVSFATKQDQDFTNNDVNQRPSDASLNEEPLDFNDDGDDNDDDDDYNTNDLEDKEIERVGRNYGVGLEVDEKSSNRDTAGRIDNSSSHYNQETASISYDNQSYQDPNVYDDDLTSREWDGLSSLPELLDPNTTRTGSTKRFRFQADCPVTALKRWQALHNSGNAQSKTNKSVTFSRPVSSNTAYRSQETENADVNETTNDDEDNLEIDFDNIDKILPKLNNPLGAQINIRKASIPPSSSPQPTPSSSKAMRPLRPLKSAPPLRRVSKSLAILNNMNKKQRSKSSMSCSYMESNTSPINPDNSGRFKLRHTTFAYKEFPPARERSRSSQRAPTKVTAIELTKPKLTLGSAEDGFEPYVIHNGRLVRRGSVPNGMFATSTSINNSTPGLVRKGSGKFSILGKDEATTLSRICDAFIIRGGSGISRRGDHHPDRIGLRFAAPSTGTGGNGLQVQQRPLSGPCGPGPTKAISRWSMATQSIITRSVSLSNLGAGASPSATGSGFEGSGMTVAGDEEIELPEEVQENLQKLGFRKHKGKRKKSEKSRKAQQKKAEVSEETLKNVIDLKHDPVLVKVTKKNRNVGTFTCEPEPQPMALCFEIKGSAPSHEDVLAELNRLQKQHPKVIITKLQFEFRSVVNNSPGMDNRWIITTNSVASRNRMAGSHIRLHGQDAQLRRYDDIITTEYQQYKRMMDFVKMMNSRLGIK